MQIHYFYKHLSEEEQQLFDRYFVRKIPKLTALVKRFEPVDCELTVERFAKKKAYKVSLNVKTAHGSFFASEDDHTIAEAVDLAKHKLARQLEKAHDRKKPSM
ncbi:MAG: HPF/RaiA family ribosome-associated protein [bacterium]|nr:HPF/RaiA family ribosome-associated protein [bacterium]